MRKVITQQSIIKENLKCARYLRKNRLQENTQNAPDTNVIIDYKKKLRMSQTNVIIDYKRKLKMREILT